MSQAAAHMASAEPKSKARPRLGFIGVGWIGWHRMKAIAGTGRADVCGIVEPQAELASRAKEVAPDAKVVGTLDELVDAGVEGVVIATPSVLHSEQTIAALQRGLAVFCQKPLGRNKQETQSAIDAARTADRLLGVDLSYRFVAGVAAIHELMRRGELGHVFQLELTFHNAYGPDKAWFYDPKLSGGGCLIDLGIHLVDLGLWLLDFPHVETIAGRLFAKGRRFVGRQFEVEDFASASIQVATGANIQLECSWNAHAGQDAVIEFAVYGTEGGAKLQNVNGSFFDFEAHQFTRTSRKTLAVPPDDWGGRAAVDWLNRLCEGNHFDPSVEHLNTVAEVLDRIYAV